MLSQQQSSSSIAKARELLGGSANTLAALQKLAGSQSGTASTDTFTQLLQLLTSQNTQSGASSDLSSLLTGNSGSELTGGSADALLQQLTSLSQNGGTALNAAQLTTFLNAQKTSGTQTQTANPANAASLTDLTALKSVEAAATDNDSGTGDMLSQQQSSSSIAKARELLNLSAKKTDDTDTDGAEMLQGTLTSSKTSSPFELRLQAAAKTGTPAVSQQIADALKENVSLGKSEFTIKLKPESLGEITVKLTEEAGKATLTITTASAATAKLLNSDLDSLKAAMAPLNVRVNETVTQTASSQQSGSQQFDMAGQQFAGQQQQQQQLAQQLAQQYAARHNAVPFSLSYAQTQNDDIYAAAAASGAAMAARVASGSALDAYV